MKKATKTLQPKNYDIEEYRRKKKRDKLIRHLIRAGALFLILAAVFGGVYLYQRYDVEQLLKNVAENTGATAPETAVQTASFPVTLDSVEPLEIEAFGNSVALLTSDEVALLDSDGKTSFQFVHGFTNPVLKTGNERVLTYDRGGYGFRLDSRQGNLYTGRSTNTILTGAAGHGAIFALVTTESHYAGSVTVYNKSGEELLKWSSSDPIIDVDFSPDDSRLAVACVSFGTSGELIASVHIFDIRKETELAVPSFADALPVAVNYKKDGRIHLVCDSMLAVVEEDLKTSRTVPYLRQLQSYAFTHEDTLLVSADSHEVASTITLVAPEGESRSLTVSSAVTDIAASEDGICILASSEVRKYSLALELLETYRVANGVFRVEIAGGRAFSLSTSYLNVLEAGKAESEESEVSS